MNIIDFTTYLIKSIVKNPDLVKVNTFDSDAEEVIIEVLVADTDMGAVIGKNGKIAKAIRTIIQAYAYVNNIKRVKINIDSF